MLPSIGKELPDERTSPLELRTGSQGKVTQLFGSGDTMISFRLVVRSFDKSPTDVSRLLCLQMSCANFLLSSGKRETRVRFYYVGICSSLYRVVAINVVSFVLCIKLNVVIVLCHCTYNNYKIRII